jgi:hypothetical protein
MVTTNLAFEQWTEVLGSERLAGALLDRLTHRVHMQEANGASYRLQFPFSMEFLPPTGPAQSNFLSIPRRISVSSGL